MAITNNLVRSIKVYSIKVAYKDRTVNRIRHAFLSFIIPASEVFSTIYNTCLDDPTTEIIS
jgi:hypothetical protein